MKDVVANAWSGLLEEQYRSLALAVAAPRHNDVGAHLHVFNRLVETIQGEHQKAEAVRAAKAATKPRRKKKKSKKKARRASNKKPATSPRIAAIGDEPDALVQALGHPSEGVDASPVDGGELPAS